MTQTKQTPQSNPMSQNENISFLSRIALFRDFTKQELELIFPYFETSFRKKSEVVFSPGDSRDRLRILISGQLQLLAQPQGMPADTGKYASEAQKTAVKNKLLNTNHTSFDESSTLYGPMQHLGEGALLQEGHKHVSLAIAQTDCVFLLLRREKFITFVTANPAIGSKLILAIGQYIFQRIQGGTLQNLGINAASYATGQKRLEHDLLGEREVPIEAYFGVQTLRAQENFNITEVTLRHFPLFIRAFAEVKKAAAMANHRVGILDSEKASLIGQACDEIINGHWHDQFVVDMIQGGAGTSTNMNANEVIANRALELSGRMKGDYSFIHPNNHVNLSQSTNDAYPTAARIALLHSVPPLLDAIRELCGRLGERASEFSDIVKMGRTQLQDAVPMTLGQEFEAYRITLEEDISRISESSRLFLETNMGGTAIGTGLNTSRGYTAAVMACLREVTGLPIVPSANFIEATHDTGSFVLFSGILKRLAVKLSKICNDLRLLSSGPRCGFGEINLPAMQPGSSIMPGKVNPVVPEVVNQVAFQVIGNDLTITMAAEAGQLQLNVMEPVIVYNLSQSLNILTKGIRTLARTCVNGITANREVCRRYVENSIGLVTALNPHIGYENSTRIAKEALETGESVFNLVLKHKLMSRDALEEALKPENMIQSHR